MKSTIQHIIFIISFFMIGNVSAQTDRKQLEEQRIQLQNEIKTINTLLSKTKKEGKNLVSQIADLNQKIKIRTKLIANINEEANIIQREIRKNERQIKDLEFELAILKRDYADMIYRSYKSKSKHSRLMFVLSADNFNQAYRRFQYMKQYTSYRKKQGEEIERKTNKLLGLTDTLKVKKADKIILLNEKKTEQERIEQEKKAQEKLVTQVKKKEKQYIAQIRAKEAQERKIDAQIERLIRDEIAKSNKKAGVTTKETKASTGFVLTAEAKALASKFTENKGKLPWPVVKGLVVRGYGKQAHPTLPGISVESNGIYIETEDGAKARAVFEGTVLAIQSVNGQFAIYIQHGNYISIYNNLEQVYVKKGDKVATKQEIGLIHTDRVTDKTILKFQMWRDTNRENPTSWIYNM
ncbi:MAG: peptidoglycan DD-metalloendopeptidase family protein [Flavobacteriaceae bacterium]|nr:peptidoglycan DD-metalloendopeptidase family protein [Flavobacteriaceae bacterium]